MSQEHLTHQRGSRDYGIRSRDEGGIPVSCAWVACTRAQLYNGLLMMRQYVRMPVGVESARVSSVIIVVSRATRRRVAAIIYLPLIIGGGREGGNKPRRKHLHVCSFGSFVLVRPVSELYSLI